MKKIYETVADMVFPGMIFTGLMVVFVGVSTPILIWEFRKKDEG